MTRKRAFDALKHLLKPLAVHEVEVIDRLCDVEVGIRVETLDEILAPVLEVALHLEFRVELELRLAVSEAPAELLAPWRCRSCK